MTETASKSENGLFVVFGGKVADTRGKDFIDLKEMDVRGFFDNYDDALAAWRAASQLQVDDAFTKYVIVRLW
ncbi:DUF4170 domain-containing protein [Sneathiella chungangensis]|uniref:DUF4170 domain-containing protein n=1 Tax=Sneathiella chungangensis TaxID=1418234 RepID=A0A845MS06_9PROT|nr:DUF4170 domain-containing protein [Sneathiella chungangensis]MZR24304.1 DUF4170 domain-containing protein [Sneathiella chungangensis]